jgi:glucosylceramidase
LVLHNPDAPSYPLSILADPAAGKYVDGTAFHLYGGDVSTFSKNA